MKNVKTSKKKFVENPSESLLDIGLGIGRGVLGSLTNDFAKRVPIDLADQILSTKGNENHRETAGDLHEGEELVLSKDKANNENKGVSSKEHSVLNTEPGIDYRHEILYGERRITSENQRELSSEIQEILKELKRIVASSKELEIAFREISITEQIVNPGKYHKSFFKWLLVIVKEARVKVEDSGAWLSAFKSKKAKKEYWTMFKKHGTTFGLSNERVVATQTG